MLPFIFLTLFVFIFKHQQEQEQQQQRQQQQQQSSRCSPQFQSYAQRVLSAPPVISKTVVRHARLTRTLRLARRQRALLVPIQARPKVLKRQHQKHSVQVR